MNQDARAKPREQKVSSQRTRWKILLLILCLLHGTNALRVPRLVSGDPGGDVTIRCPYAPSSVNRHQRKYWCRLRPPLWICYTIVSTNHYTHHDYRGRVALTDFPQRGFFMVKLFQLSPNDTGLYRCGIGDRNDRMFFKMNLIVSAGPSNTTYAAAPASGELITASPERASAAANRWTPEVTKVTEGRGSGWNRTAPATENRWTLEVTQVPEDQGSEWNRTTPATENRWTLEVTQVPEDQGSEWNRTAPATENRWTLEVTQVLESRSSEWDRTTPATENRWTPEVTQVPEDQGSEWNRTTPATESRWTLEVTQVPEDQGSEWNRTTPATENRWTLEVTQVLESRSSEWDRTALTTRISKTTASGNERQTLNTARTTVPGTSRREEGSLRATVPTPESPASKSRSMFSTTQDVWIWGTGNSVTTSPSTSESEGKDTTPEADGPQEETEGAPTKTTRTTQPSVLISEHVTWETLQEAMEVSKQQKLYYVEESSPAPSAQTLNTTHMQVVSGSIDRGLENTSGESSPPTPSQLSSKAPLWAPGKGSSMKSAFTEGESNSWILTPASTALTLVLLSVLVLLKRRLWRERPSQEAERPPRITLIQMTHFPPDKLPAMGKNLQQSDLPPVQASLSVLETNPGL